MTVELEREFWENAARTSDNLVRDFIWDPDVDNAACLTAVLDGLGKGPILEIGCGIGRLTTLIAECRPDTTVIGIDISPTMIALAAGKSGTYAVNDGRTIPFADESFGSAYCVAVFQHIPYEGICSYLSEVHRVLKPSGTFRFQVVQGEEHADINHQYPEDEVLIAITDAGLTVNARELGIAIDNWLWITATK